MFVLPVNLIVMNAGYVIFAGITLNKLLLLQNSDFVAVFYELFVFLPVLKTMFNIHNNLR